MTISPRTLWEQGDFYHAGLAMTKELGERSAAFVAILLTDPPIPLGESELRNEVVALLTAPDRWKEAGQRFKQLRRSTLLREPDAAVQLCEAALKLAHNLQAGEHEVSYDAEQAARIVMFVGRLASPKDSSYLMNVFDALIRARDQALA